MGDADTVNIQSLIKRVIETTRCSPSQAELALYDNDNDVFAAVEYILDQGADIESWTEQKSRKDKKKEEEDKKDRGARGQQSARGRGAGTGDRGGRGRGGSASQHRGGSSRGGGAAGRGGRGQSAAARQPGRSQAEGGVLKPVDLNEESSDWKNGPMEFKRSEPAVPSSSTTTSAAAPVSTPNNSTSSSSSSSAPISFAAVAAAGARKEQQKNLPPAPAPEPPREPTPEPHIETSKENFTSEPSVANPKVETENVPVNQEEPVNVVSVHSVQATPPQLQANVTWTTQLKSDLGIGVPLTSPKPQQFPVTLPGVEFVSESAAAGLADFHFGFVDTPPVVPAPVVEPTHVPTAELFATARHPATTQVAPLKTTPEIHSTLGNGDYPIRTASPPAANNSLAQAGLGYTDRSTVSYTNTPISGVDSRSPNVPKPPSQMGTQPQAHQQQQHQQQPQQQAMFTSQMPFSYPNPYAMNIPSMYSPVTGMRPEEQAYANLLAQYPFTMPGMDMTNLMGGAAYPQSSSTQSLSSQHRNDSHNMDNTMKFSSQGSRDQNQQPSAVQPPPGFATNHFGMQPQLNLMAQQYNPHNAYAQFMMPNVGNIGTAGGRQMYSQEEDRKSYDKMSGVKSQQTQPQTYHNGGHYGMSGGGRDSSKKYNNNWPNN